MQISLGSIVHFCPRCNRSCWFYHRPNGRWVCRGLVPLSLARRGDVPPDLFPGCGREYEKKEDRLNGPI